jgi:hypothetical protein
MKIKRKRFMVAGHGTFPFDMLRYDHCWPETEAKDSHKLDTPSMDGDDWARERVVALLTDSPNAPTVGRWKSMGWVVIAEEVVR